MKKLLYTTIAFSLLFVACKPEKKKDLAKETSKEVKTVKKEVLPRMLWIKT